MEKGGTSTNNRIKVNSIKQGRAGKQETRIHAVLFDLMPRLAAMRFFAVVPRHPATPVRVAHPSIS
jgi:hypothetical protein